MKFQKILFKFITLGALFGLSTGHVLADWRGPGGIGVDEGTAGTEQRLALVIGNSQYRSDYLPNAQHDAEDIAKVLRRYGFTVIHKQDLKRAALKKAIREFSQRLTKNGVGLFYYAGHGMQIEQRNFLIPIGAEIFDAGEVEFEAVDAQRVVNMMTNAGSRVSIVILDACRNNPFRSYFRSSNGLAAMHAPRGTIISFATAPGKKASDGGGRNGLYTAHLLSAIQTPGLTIEEVFKQTATAVEKKSGGIQWPWRSSSLTGKDFCFTACQKKRPDDDAEKTALQQRLAELERQLAQFSSTTTVQQQTPSDIWAPGKVFRDRLQDGSFGPEMVGIPAGSFRMGDLQGGGFDNEQPVHRVSVARFAMGKYEVTFAEYDKFAEATGRAKPNDQGWGRGNRPVINVSWDDATAYAAWLTQQTGRQYRLPSEAEWEYAARAGTTTKYWWGNQWVSGKASCDYQKYHKTTPVGSFDPNPFGLYDTVGNVWEWCADPWHKNYKNAPTDGSVWDKHG